MIRAIVFRRARDDAGGGGLGADHDGREDGETEEQGGRRAPTGEGGEGCS